MITAQEAKTITKENKEYKDYLKYYEELIDKGIKKAASEGRSTYSLRIDKGNKRNIKKQIVSVLSCNGFDITICDLSDKYHIWISW